jgi:hypothetical protein
LLSGGLTLHGGPGLGATGAVGGRLPAISLDPALAASIMRQSDSERQARAQELARRLFDPATVEAAARNVGIIDSPTPSLSGAPTPAQQPLVPAEEGPETAQAAGAGDLVRAVMAVPAVQAAVNRARDQATERLRRDWRRLSTGERAAVITMSVVIAGGAVAGVASNPATREAVLGQLDGRDIPMGPVSMHIDRPDPSQLGITLTVDLAQLVPALAQ